MNPTVTMAAPLPVDFRGTPQQWFEAMLARMALSGLPVGFVVSDAMPTSNQGPWLKGGTEIWVWDEDTATYVPQSLSFLTRQVWIGDKSTPPDATKYQIWLQTSGSTFAGWAVYLGSFIGWVSPNSAIAAGSITNVMLADPAVYRDNIADGEVTANKIQNALPVTKLAVGTADQCLRTNADGTTAVWDYVFHEGPEHAWTNNSSDSFSEPHGLSRAPRYVRPVLHCHTTDGSYTPGMEIDAREVWKNDSTHYFDGLVFDLWADSTNIRVNVVAGTTLSTVQGLITATKWKIKLYWGK